MNESVQKSIHREKLIALVEFFACGTALFGATFSIFMPLTPCHIYSLMPIEYRILPIRFSLSILDYIFWYKGIMLYNFHVLQIAIHIMSMSFWLRKVWLEKFHLNITI